MATSEEIPLDNQETVQETQDIPEETQDIAEENVEPPAPKKKGRPPGSRNKPKPEPKAPPPKPAPKPKPKPKRKPVVEEEYDSEEEEYQPQRRAPELDRHQLASEVLGLLQQQRYHQATRKANHYRSWFQNMS